MPAKKPKTEPMSRVAMKARIVELESEVEDLESTVEDLEKDDARTDDETDDDVSLSHVRDQIDSLAVEIRHGAVTATPDQMCRLLREIAAGGDWRNGTWK